jgi:hypothetical protein
MSQLSKLKFERSYSLFWNLSALITLIGSLAIFYLPERYMFDAFVIKLDRYNEIGLIGSYPFSIWFYNVLGLSQVPFPVIALIQIPLVFFLLYLVGIPKSFARLTLRNAVIWLGLFVFAIYMGFPSKEFITILVIFLIVFILKMKMQLYKKMVVSSALLIGFGLIFRQYFILMPFLAFGIYLFSFVKIKNKVFYNIVIGIIIVSFMSLSHGFIKGEFITQGFRNKLNTERLDSENENAATLILSPIKPDTFHGEVFGIVYGFFSVNLPIAGLRFLLKPQVLIFVAWQLSLFYLLWIYYGRALRDKRTYAHHLWAFHLVFAYFIIQGIFEPDLGSAVKHKLGVFPLIWLAIYYDMSIIKRNAKPSRYAIQKVN